MQPLTPEGDPARVLRAAVSAALLATPAVPQKEVPESIEFSIFGKYSRLCSFT